MAGRRHTLAAPVVPIAPVPAVLPPIVYDVNGVPNRPPTKLQDLFVTTYAATLLATKGVLDLKLENGIVLRTSISFFTTFAKLLLPSI